MKVVIVSRTRMHSGVCIGGLTRDELRNVRLLPPSGEHAHPEDAAYGVGQVWDLDLEAPAEVRPPHVEDMLVRAARYVASQVGLATWLGRSVHPWEGDASALFDGLLHVSSAGTAYISHAAVPAGSVGFWRPATDLHLSDGDHPRYTAPFDGRTISLAYVGVDEPMPLIPAGSLVRVSLARWFSPSGTAFEGCWLQLSGWYKTTAGAA